MRKTIAIIIVFLAFAAGCGLLLYNLNNGVKTIKFKAPSGYPYVVNSMSEEEIERIKLRFLEENRLDPDESRDTGMMLANEYTGVIESAGADVKKSEEFPLREEARQLAQNFLNKNKKYLGLSESENVSLKDPSGSEAKIIKAHGNSNNYYFVADLPLTYHGLTIARYNPFYAGISGINARNLVMVKEVGEYGSERVRISFFNWEYYPQLKENNLIIPVRPNITESQALDNLHAYEFVYDETCADISCSNIKVNFGKNNYEYVSNGLHVLPLPAHQYGYKFAREHGRQKNDLEFRLAYMFYVISGEEQAAEEDFPKNTKFAVFVDAITGEILNVAIN